MLKKHLSMLPLVRRIKSAFGMHARYHSVDEEAAAKTCVSADVSTPARTIDKVASGSYYASHAVGRSQGA